MAIQKEFDLPDLSEDDMAGLKTIADVVKLVRAVPCCAVPYWLIACLLKSAGVWLMHVAHTYVCL